ncbi:MAG TPA: hypothetical protein ENK95_04085 [Campylobacterales bacterium]|nr:hypothetical protein [Campylobacterales bacterium]
MNGFIKRTLLTTLLTTSLLISDGEDIGISVSNAPALQENGGSTNFTIQLTEEADWCDEVEVNYYTQNNSAQAGSDYVSKSGSETFYGACLFPPRFASPTSKTISVNIVDDTTHEST